jgi:hypothetical protein
MEAAETKTGTSHRQEADLRDAPVAARERGRIRVADILNREDMLSAEAFVEPPGTTRVTVNTSDSNGRLSCRKGAKQGFRFAVWQIGSNGRAFAVRRRRAHLNAAGVFALDAGFGDEIRLRLRTISPLLAGYPGSRSSKC